MAGNGMSAREALWARQQQRMMYHPEIERAMEGVKFIADHLKDDDREEQVGSRYFLSKWKIIPYSLAHERMSL